MPKFMDIGPLVPETKIFEVFFIYGDGGHIGHVTSIITINVKFHVAKSLHSKFG